MIEQKHIINKVFFEVNTSNTKTAYDLKDNLDTFLKQSLFPTIQAYFDSLTSGKDQIIRFDKLELNIDSTDVKDQVQLQLDIIKSLQKQLKPKKESKTFTEKDPAFLITNQEKSDIETFFYFLKFGQNPWWVSKNDIEDNTFLEAVISSKNFRKKLNPYLLDTSVRQRLVYQFSDEVLLKILGSDKLDFQFPKILKAKKVREHYWELLFKYIGDRNIRVLQGGFVMLFSELKKDDKIQKNVSKILSKEVTRIIELEKTDILQKTNKHLKVLELRNSILKSVEKIVVKELKSIKKKEEVKEAFKIKVYNELHGEFKEFINTRFLNEIIKVSAELFHQILQEEFYSFQEKILPFTSELISKKLEGFRYNEIELLDKPINKNQYLELQETPKVATDFYQYIQNGGLLLLHPYIERLFSELKLLTREKKIKEKKVALAIHLLHYLATKREKQIESDLVFEKFLCGYPINKPIRKNIRLPQNFKEEAELLLKALLNNWKALKNTSTDGLRENFIKREGKLMSDDPSRYRVIVERKTQDILLEKLPWNLTIIKLPWIDRLIFVEW
ncbi:contractile injection system tape measure protein [uncultured Aquimarina sp.]|uniref:contractile injection system tape measure protein n=1 Tax=uncultured Aquimarina sp. TaxID=575652 RepID=UPI00262CC21F|nr:contractile injection system tape measure protein [uncultured Aquimarina sp.]